MAPEGMDLVPIVDDDGVLTRLLTERGARAALHPRVARGLAAGRADAGRLDRRRARGRAARRRRRAVEIAGPRLGAGDALDVARARSSPATSSSSATGPTPQQRAIERRHRAARAQQRHAARPSEILELAAEHGTCVVTSPLDSYVTSRMITLSEPCRALAEADPLTVGKDDLVRDIADQIKDVHYRAAVAVDRDGKPVGVVTRSDLVNPEPRRVLLVDHGERAQSVPGIEEAEIVEILDHHHIGSIETKLPVTAIFDPVGSTATLVIERFRQADAEPTEPTATMLLGAIVSDTVLLTSPTTTERDRVATRLPRGAAVARRPAVRPRDVRAQLRRRRRVGRRSRAPRPQGVRARQRPDAERRADRDRRRRGVRAHRGAARAPPSARRARHDHVLFAVMLTDILAQHTRLLVAGNEPLAERAFGEPVVDGAIELPGVMSRKKQVAPGLLAAASG